MVHRTPANSEQIEYYFESACITVQARIPSCAPSKPTLLSITHISAVAVCLLSVCLQTLFHIYAEPWKRAESIGIRQSARRTEASKENSQGSSLAIGGRCAPFSFFVVRRILIELRDAYADDAEGKLARI